MRKIVLSSWTEIWNFELQASVLVWGHRQPLIRFCAWNYWHRNLFIWYIKCLAPDLAYGNNECISDSAHELCKGRSYINSPSLIHPSLKWHQLPDFNKVDLQQTLVGLGGKEFVPEDGDKLLVVPWRAQNKGGCGRARELSGTFSQPRGQWIRTEGSALPHTGSSFLWQNLIKGILSSIWSSGQGYFSVPPRALYSSFSQWQSL